MDAEQRDHQRPEEPDDVQVEPVGDPELEADEHGGRQRGEPDEVAPPGHEGDGDREQHGAHLHDRLRRRPVAQAPDAERRAALGLESERAVEERPRVAVGQDEHERQREHDPHPDGEADRAPRVRDVQRPERQRRELRHARKPDEHPAAQRRRRREQRAQDERADERVVASVTSITT